MSSQLQLSRDAAFFQILPCTTFSYTSGNAPDNVNINGIDYQVIRVDDLPFNSVTYGPNGATNYNHAEQKLMGYVQTKYSGRDLDVSIAVENTSASSPGMCSGCSVTSNSFAQANPEFNVNFYVGSTKENK